MDNLPAIAAGPLGRATLGDQLRRHARTLRDKPAFVSYGAEGTRRITSYRELDEGANRFASALLARGVRRGDRIAVMARNGVESVVAYFGALKVGAAFSGINVLFREAEVAAQLSHLEPAVVVAAPEFVPIVDRVREQLTVANWFVHGDAADGWESVAELVAAGDPGEPDCEVSEADLALVVYT